MFKNGVCAAQLVLHCRMHRWGAGSASLGVTSALRLLSFCPRKLFPTLLFALMSQARKNITYRAAYGKHSATKRHD